MLRRLPILALAALAILPAPRALAQGRPAHPGVPSIPLLTLQEKAHVAAAIRAMILDDLGKLKGPVDREAIKRAFDGLGRESVPQLIEAFNFVCNEGWTCPANILGARLGNLLASKRDLDMAEYFKKYVGMGVKNPKPPTPFKDVLNASGQIVEATRKHFTETYKTVKVSEISDLALKSIGAESHIAFTEISKRKGDSEAFDFLLLALEKSATAERRKLARDGLVKWSGVDHGPEQPDSAGALTAAVGRWKEWRDRDKE